jgi:hypothetical protein
MPTDDNDGAAKGLVAQVAHAVLKEAAGTEKMRAAGEEAAEAIHTLVRFGNNFLGLVRHLNRKWESAAEYFEKRFETDLHQKTKDIPAEDLIAPPSALLLPAASALAISHEEAELKDMFLSLIASAMDSRKSTHPSFVDIIRQLTAEEAVLLRAALQFDTFPYVEVHRLTGNLWLEFFGFDSSFSVIFRHVFPLKSPLGGEAFWDDHRRTRSILENWIRLRLFELDDLGRHLADKHAYAWVDEHPAITELRKRVGRRRVRWIPRTLRLTNYGRWFAEAIGVKTRSLKLRDFLPDPT